MGSHGPQLLAVTTYGKFESVTQATATNNQQESHDICTAVKQKRHNTMFCCTSCVMHKIFLLALNVCQKNMLSLLQYYCFMDHTN